MHKSPEEIMEAFKCFDAIAYIEQLEKQMPRWISVKDSMPEPGEEVLVVDDFGCVGTGECEVRNVLAVKDGRLVNKTERYIYVEGGSQFGAIPNAKYWMPLPEPPKEEAHGSETGEKVDGWTYRYIAQLEANQIKGRCKDCKYVISETYHGKISDDFVCGDGWTKADGYCDEWEPREDA